jgi:hypothetical protein
LTLDQEQPVPFVFDLPVLITLQDENHARRVLAPITDRRTLLEYSFDKRPLRVDVDPEYDLLRYLDPTEQPPALNRLFGSTRTWLVLPTATTTEMREAWIALAEAWQRRYPELKLIDDTAAGRLPSNADRLLLGWDNALLDPVRSAFVREDQSLGDREVAIGGTRYRADAVGLVLVASDAQGVTTGFIGAPTPQLIGTLARKLTHYGSYGRLLFDARGENLLRDTLSSDHSRLSQQFGDAPTPLRPPPRSVLGAGGD